MSIKKVNGWETIKRNTELIRNRNMELWAEKELGKRIRGNAWIVFRRLIYDYRNHYGNEMRAKKRQMPFVDSQGYLYTSKAPISYAEGKCMSNLTVGRWLERFQKEDFDGERFILECYPLTRYCMKIKLNHSFFVMEEEY